MGAMVPALFAGLIDDAALFPPGNAPMAEAVPAHAEHRKAWYADLVGPFLCTDTRLPELQRVLEKSDTLDVGLLVTGGAGAIRPALTWVERDSRLVLKTVEIALRDEPDLARNAQRIALAFDSAGLPDDIPVAVEVPRTSGWERALDALAETGHRAKLRTGGVQAEPAASGWQGPDEAEVARFVLACLDRELPFKCTAGLHHAVRHTADDGTEQHGFGNILIATRAGLDGGTEDDLVRLLAERDSTTMAAKLREVTPSTRQWFTSYGSCSIDEPLDELRAFGVLDAGE
jgi:hypothetical protein